MTPPLRAAMNVATTSMTVGGWVMAPTVTGSRSTRPMPRSYLLRVSASKGSERYGFRIAR